MLMQEVDQLGSLAVQQKHAVGPTHWDCACEHLS